MCFAKQVVMLVVWARTPASSAGDLPWHFVTIWFYWSGRGDLNARPPTPKADSGEPRKWPVFNCFRFKPMRRHLLSCVAPFGTRRLRRPHFYLHPVSSCAQL